MAAVKTRAVGVEALLRVARTLVRLPANHMTVDYDEGADVLYLNFGRPQTAADADEVKPGVLVRTRGRKIVGVTILDASKR